MGLSNIWKDKIDGETGDIIYADDPTNGGINQIATSAAKCEDVVDDIVGLPTVDSEIVRIIDMEPGSLGEAGELVDSSSRIRSDDFISVDYNVIYTFTNDMDYNMHLMSYDADKNFLRHDSTNRGITILNNNVANVKFVKLITSTGENDLNVVFKVSNGIPGQGYQLRNLEKVALPLLEFDNGYSMSTTEMNPGLWQLQLSKEGSEFNIFTVKSPYAKPYEATLALSQKGSRTRQFVDFSSMRYDENARGTVEIVCQVRGETTPLPPFSVRFNDGQGAGRVKKFTVDPDCIPIEMTSEGLKVRRNNNYDNEDTGYVTINLASLFDKVTEIDAGLATTTLPYSETKTYMLNDMCCQDGVTFVSLQDNNTGNALTLTDWWKRGVGSLPNKYLELTLAASGWVGSAAPYTQLITATGVTTTTNGEIYISQSATDEQYVSACNAQLRLKSQAENSITIVAYGTKPNVNIPVTLKIEF